MASPPPMLGVYQAPGANAVAVAEAVRATMERLAKRFPDDIKYEGCLRHDGVRDLDHRGSHPYADRSLRAGGRGWSSCSLGSGARR